MKLDELKLLASAVPNFHSADAHAAAHALMREMGLDPNAIYQELEMSSRFVDTHRDTSYSNGQVQLHSHTFYEIICCRSSGGAEYLVGPERYRIQRGDIIFVPPGVSHRPLLPGEMTEPYSRYVLWLSPEFVAQYLDLLPGPLSGDLNRAGMLRTAGTVWEDLVELFRRGVAEAETRAEGWQAAVIGNTILLLTRIKRATDERSVRALKAEKAELIDRITAFVEEHYTTPFTIGDLSARLYISSSTVSHLFKQKMGVSLHRYVTQRRLIAAKPLIERGTPLEAVCLQVGFGDYSAFYRAFRQEYGISPRRYRALQEPPRK